ncbi:SHOCT domain-containing protein [Streptococcus suis]|nr:SHOCT domain-containing protein [Streptococcus suis]
MLTGGKVLEQSVVKYSMQLSMLNFLYSRNMVTKKEYEKIKNRLRIKYTK